MVRTDEAVFGSARWGLSPHSASCSVILSVRRTRLRFPFCAQAFRVNERRTPGPLQESTCTAHIKPR